MIKIFTKGADDINDPNTFKEAPFSVLTQLNKLPSETKRQIQELTVPDDVLQTCKNVSELIYLKCMGNSRRCHDKDRSGLYCHMLSLKLALVNHSCVPNVTQGFRRSEDAFNVEVKAIQDILRGEEVTVSYLDEEFISEFGLNRENRREKLKSSLGFDCNCSFCTERPD